MLNYAFFWGILIQPNVGNDVMEEKKKPLHGQIFVDFMYVCHLVAQILLKFVENLFVAIV